MWSDSARAFTGPIARGASSWPAVFEPQAVNPPFGAGNGVGESVADGEPLGVWLADSVGVGVPVGLGVSVAEGGSVGVGVPVGVDVSVGLGVVDGRGVGVFDLVGLGLIFGQPPLA